jgi:carboxylate-amine ligase
MLSSTPPPLNGRTPDPGGAPSEEAAPPAVRTPPVGPLPGSTPTGHEVTATLGVEEEFLVVDRETRELVPRGHELIDRVHDLGQHVSAELNHCQIEVDTPVCTDLATLREEVVAKRERLRVAGEEVGLAAAAMATHPFSSWRTQEVDTDEERYEALADRYRLLVREQVICGCHVHVGIADPHDRVAVLKAAGAWLPTLLALSTNSPYWQGEDSGYASYRTVIWSRWPTSGMPPSISSPEELQAIIDDLVAVGAIEDETHLYWWVRPSLRHPTVEFRVCDTFLFADDVVGAAGLVRALCWTALNAPETLPAVPGRQVLRAAVWHAARYGMRRNLMDPSERSQRPAPDVVRALVDSARPGLEHYGDDEVVPDLIEHIISRGTGASAQRLTRAEETSGVPVVDMVLDRMHRSQDAGSPSPR